MPDGKWEQFGKHHLTLSQFSPFTLSLESDSPSKMRAIRGNGKIMGRDVTSHLIMYTWMEVASGTEKMYKD